MMDATEKRLSDTRTTLCVEYMELKDTYFAASPSEKSEIRASLKTMENSIDKLTRDLDMEREADIMLRINNSWHEKESQQVLQTMNDRPKSIRGYQKSLFGEAA